jgi:hypothetical protein
MGGASQIETEGRGFFVLVGMARDLLILAGGFVRSIPITLKCITRTWLLIRS